MFASLVAVPALVSIGFSANNELLWAIQVSTALTVIPIAITVAITRHRLFDIDRLISRTISYTVVIGVLGAGYLGMVGLFTTLVPAEGSLAVALSTLAVAALFQHRVQAAVNRRFNRSQFLAEAVAETFAADLHAVHSLDEVTRLTTQTIGQTLQPTALALWIAPSEPDARVPADGWSERV